MLSNYYVLITTYWANTVSAQAACSQAMITGGTLMVQAAATAVYYVVLSKLPS